ncbi:LPD38 domain-containing protein [Haemophilus parahaemolyticus]|uniref:MuF-C-terminal domain-containing protein n=1 Tax=Haemophilus parahaemolyticus TaxID=735 RepID=UPI0028EBD7F8|nr:LPD38 domain-containing protein [Haemophilus parahaemolyticus]
MRNATLGAIAGLGMGVPAATEAYINGRNAPQAEEPVVNPESHTQPEQPTTTPINSQALDEALKPYQDSEEYAEMRADLEQDIQDGVIEERAKSNSQYGKLAQAYLNAMGQVTEPQAESNTQEQAEIDDGTDPEMERVLNLRERMTAWRNGKKLGKIGDLLPAMMTFKNEDAKRDFVVQQAFGEVQSIAKKHGIDPTDGNAMRKWLDDYVAKRKEVQTKAKQTREESYRAYDDFLSNEPLAVEPEQAVENPQNVTNLSDNFITQASNEAFKKYEGELNALVSDVYEGKITAEEFEQRKNAFIHAVSKEATEKLTQHQDFVPYIREKVLAHNKLTQAETELQQTAEPQRVEENAELRFSLNESSDSPFAKAVDTVAQGGNVSGYVNVGTTPSVLKMLGLPDVKVSIHSSTFKKVMGGKHQVTPETLKQLPQQINNPIAVMRSSTEPNGYVVLTELIERENGKDKPVIAALHLKQDANGLELLNIASVYGRSNAQIQRGLNNDLLYWNKAKGTKFVSTFGLQLPAYVDNNSSLSARNVKTETDLSQYQNPQSEQSIETESDEQLTQESYSRSPIKSVDANIKRGREAMNKAIAERRTVHRAMFNHNLDGWVDFEWGDDGLTKPFNKKGEPVGKGISHIIEARMRKDGMSYDQVVRMLTQNIVDTIAKGRVHKEAILPDGKVKNVQLDYNGHRAVLIKKKGNNGWILTAFELHSTDVNSAGSVDTERTTNTKPTLTRQGEGAVELNSNGGQRVGFDTTEPTHSKPTRTRQGMGAFDGNNVQQSEAKRNQQDAEQTHARTLLRRALGEHADKIELVRDEQFGENDARRGAEGWYHNGKLYLNLDGITDGNILSKDERLVWVAWHELGHHGVEVQLSHALRNQLHQARKNVVVNGIAKRIFAERQAEAKRENNPNLAISQDVATEEAIVELFAAMETGNWAEIESRYRVHIVQEWRQPQSDLVKRLSHVANFFKRLVARITGKNLDTVSNQEVLNLLATVKQGIAKSSENSTASEARYSLSEESDSDFAKAVDEVFNSSETHFDNNRWIKLGTTPEALIQSGISEEPMYINFAKIGKIKNDHPEMTADLLKQIPKELNNPVAVFKNTKGKANSYVVLTELSVKGNERVIAALHADQEMNGLVFHKLASAYGKDGTRAYLENMIEKSDVRFVDKRKAGRINSRLQLLADDTLDLLFNKASIVKDESSVNADKEKGSQLANVHWLQLPLKLRSDANLSANDIKTETDLSQYQSENSEVRFSRKAPKQDTPYQRDLMVTHNISAKGIMHAKKMGGLPFASVAVAKQSNPLTGFGEVTLIGNRDYIDPKGANKAKVFGADIYSPRHSGLGITYRINAKDVNALNKQFEESAKAIGDNKFSYDFSYQGLEDKGVVNTLENSTAVKYQFLKENGVAVEPVYDAPVEVANNQMNYPSIQQAKAQGISRSAFVNNDELLTRFVEDHIADLSERLEKAEKMGNSLVRNHAKRNLSVAQKILESGIESIRHHYRMKILDLKYDEETQAAPRLNAGKTATKINELVEERASDFADYVDNIASSIDVEERIDDGEARDGTRKTIPHNLENVVKKLKQNIRGGEKFGIGQGNVRAKVTPQFDSIADIQDNKHRIVSADEFETVRSELEAEAQALGNEFNTSDIYDLLWNAAEEGIPQAFHYADVKNTARNRKLVQDYLDKLEAMPTEYFEGKAKDVTQFSDFSGAVIPNNLPKNAYDVLQQAGLKIYEYDPDVETSRAEIIKQATNELDEQSGGNILFSRKARTNDLDADFENATPKRTANSFEEARAAVTELLGEPLVNRESGMIATISKRSLDKLVSGKAADKSSSREDHLIAVANIDQLFENAIEGWAEPAKSEENTALKSVHKMFAPININGEMKLAKLTVKEFNDNSGNRIYSVETLEVGNKNSTMPELSASVQSERTLDGLHSATLNSLIQRIQDFNSRDENSEPLFSRKQTSMEILTDGKVKHETLWGTVKAGEFGKIWNEVQRKTDFALTDETRPVLDWIGDLDLAQVQANELKSDFELADGVRHSLNSQLMQRFLKPLHKNIVNLAKKRKKDIEWTKKALGIWVSANYSIQKNQELLARDEQAMIEAKQAFDDAKANGTNAEIDKAERAYIRAERQYRYRKHDVELNNWEVDEKGKFIVPRKVGVAGFSIPHAKALMAEVEKHFSQKEVLEATEPLRKAVKWNIHKNREFNRITEEQFKEYMRNLDYVPLTGDPDSLLKDDDDFIGGASSKGVNTSRDKNMRGRVNSEAEDAIDAVYRMLDKTVANAAWQPFKNGIDTVYEQKLAEAKAQGMTEEQAKEHVADTVGIRRQVMQGTTRTNDEVLIRKFGNVYYEYRLPEDVIKAIKGGQRNVDEFKVWQYFPMRYVRKLTGLNAQGVTQFKLPFAPKNMIRDIWEKSALITTRDIYDANGKPLSQKAKNRIGSRTFSALANPAEMARVLRATSRLAKGDTENLDVNDEYQRDLKELIELGGVSNYSTYLARTDKDLVEEIKKLDKPHHRAVEGALHLVAVWNGTFDYASSLAAYRALKEAGVDKKQAADITLNLTNFRKQGWAAKHFKPLYMFLNPTLQGGKNLVQMMKTRRGQVYLASRVVMAMAVWSFLMSLDDDDDQGGKRMLANGDLSREILIPTGEKDKYIRIPVGYGAPQMANNIATNLVQLMNNQISVGDAVANIITHNVKSVLPIAPSEISASKDPLAKLADTLTPSLFKAQMQWLMDRNAFGASIKPNSVQREKLLSQQSRQNTAEFWKETAEMMYEQFGVDMHPEFYKHIFDSYRGMMGSLGDYVSASIENPNRALQGKSEVVPIVNDYYGVRGENRIASLFYEYKGEAEKLAAEYKYYESKGRLAEWKTPEKMQIVNWNNKVNDEMKKVTQARSNLKKDEGKMSEEMKASRLQNINTINDRIQREAVYAWRKREGLATANPR